MRWFSASLRALALCSSCWLSCAVQAAAQAALDGTWVGTLSAGGTSLQMVVNLSHDASGQAAGTLDSPSQLAFDIPLDVVSFDGQRLHFESKAVSGAFDGELQADGTTLVGTWSQGGQSAALTLVPGAPAARPKRPQEPQAPFPYDVEDVSYDNAAAGVHLAGTLTTPRSRGRHPAVLLITGSGAQDRNESLAGHKPFLVIADALTRRGISVLRVDDRGVGGSTGSVDQSTTADFAQDALAGVAYLRSRNDIDARHIGLIGHSEGGEVAPLAAAGSQDVAFVVLLAGPGVPNTQVLLRQTEAIAIAGGMKPEYAALERELTGKLLDVVKAEPDDQRALEQMNAAWQTMKADLLAHDPSDELKALIAQEDSSFAASTAQLITPWYRYFVSYDPAPALRQLRVPVLALNGSRDLQVDPKENLPAIEAALREGGDPDFVIEELPGLNHLFQTAQTGLPDEYQTIEETFAPAALQRIGDFIVERTCSLRTASPRPRP